MAIVYSQMLFNISSTDKKTRRQIDELVGRPYLLLERLKMKGIGSPRLLIEERSAADKNRSHRNIELRTGQCL